MADEAAKGETLATVDKTNKLSSEVDGTAEPQPTKITQTAPENITETDLEDSTELVDPEDAIFIDGNQEHLLGLFDFGEDGFDFSIPYGFDVDEFTQFVDRLPPEISKRRESSGEDDLREKQSIPIIRTIVEIFTSEYLKRNNMKQFPDIFRQTNPQWASETLCNIYIDDVISDYVYLTVQMDTSELTLEERKYLVLFSAAILETPYLDDSQTLFDASETIAGLYRDVAEYKTFFGIDGDAQECRFFCGQYPHLFCIKFKIELRKVREGFEWMEILLWNTTWDPFRLKQVAEKLVKEAEVLKTRGDIMAKVIMNDDIYQMDSNPRAISLLRQQVFLRRIASKLPEDFPKISSMLEAVRMACLRPENTTVHVAGNLQRMDFHLTDKPEIRDAIAQLFRRTFDYFGWGWGFETKRLANDPGHKWMKSITCINKCAKERILPIETADKTSFLYQVSPAIREFAHPDYAKILVAIEYFCQPNGLFHEAIVVSGFAESFALQVYPSIGMLTFEISHASDLFNAYYVVFNMIKRHIDEESIWIEEMIESSQKSALYNLLDRFRTPEVSAESSLIDSYREMSDPMIGKLMKDVVEVTLDDVRQMTVKYFHPMFIKTSTCVVTAPKDKIVHIVQEMIQ